jgi:hypothetical protein
MTTQQPKNLTIQGVLTRLNQRSFTISKSESIEPAILLSAKADKLTVIRNIRVSMFKDNNRLWNLTTVTIINLNTFLDTKPNPTQTQEAQELLSFFLNYQRSQGK